MAGVSKSKTTKGKCKAWFMNYDGKQEFFTGTTNPKETLAMARKFEDDHRQMRLGYRPKPKSFEKPCPYEKVTAEYVSWGASVGGRGRRPWSPIHTKKRAAQLKFWGARLHLKCITDLVDLLPRLEAAMRELQSEGKAGKTIRNRVESLSAFCDWAVSRGYLEKDPLTNLTPVSKTPTYIRRAMTEDEMSLFLSKCYPPRRIVYEMAICSGLRANELRSLIVGDLDAKRGGIVLHPEWTKNRKPGFQPLPSWLIEKLAATIGDKSIKDKLLEVPLHLHVPFDNDLARAGIPKLNEYGKLDFHALRVAYTTLVFESGATVKEAQTLARHSTPDLTMNIYARTRDERLIAVAEKVGEKLKSIPASEDHGQFMIQGSKRGEKNDVKGNDGDGLDEEPQSAETRFESPRVRHLNSAQFLRSRTIIPSVLRSIKCYCTEIIVPTARLPNRGSQ
jgi:integrase